MSVLSWIVPLWAQAEPSAGGGPGRLLTTLSWLFLYGEPGVSMPGRLGDLLTWFKVVGLFCLLGWVGSWAIAALKKRSAARTNALDVAALVALIGGLAAMLLRVLNATGRVGSLAIAGQPLSGVLGVVCALVLLLWVEAAIWSAIRRRGRSGDWFVLSGIHLALGLGVAVGFGLYRSAAGSVAAVGGWQDALVLGARLGATYMGYVVLARVAALLIGEVASIRGRRLYAIAWQNVIESTRRMWAPWVVLAVFLVILAFTDWFLQPPRPAEMGRLYVGTLALLCSLLLTVMVAILTPISLPNDIQQQTIYTVVSKPVRRIELVWGRILGTMFLVTALLVAFGGISLLYLYRNINGAIVTAEREADRAREQNRPDRARLLAEEADQLRTRMSAREPVKGSLTFIDSKGTPQIKGIDVGQELEYRSHIEGATPSMAIWTFGVVPDPIDQKFHEKDPNYPVQMLDRRVPVYRLLEADTIEGLLDRWYELGYEEAETEARLKATDLPASESSRLTAELSQTRETRKRLGDEVNAQKAQAEKLEARAAEADAAGKADEAEALRTEAEQFHSPPVPVEMTFTVYRTTKGVLGEAVLATLSATNPRTGFKYSVPFPIREYYTNKQGIDPEVLAGSRGDLRIEVQCVTPNQYLGTAESDLFLLAESGKFGWNFMKGLAGIWLQALVLTAIGVFAGTFLSWPVALLTTVAFFVAGQVAFGFLQEFALATLQGGGPFESLIRLLSHDNLQNELSPTLAVVSAKTLDAIVMPIMSRLVYLVPNFAALDMSNTVADGFAVSNGLLFGHVLLALAYALPFSVAGYFILKHREVAA